MHKVFPEKTRRFVHRMLESLPEEDGKKILIEDPKGLLLKKQKVFSKSPVGLPIKEW